MKPILEEIAEKYKDTLTLTKIDVDQEQQLASEYQVLSIPTMVFKKNGVVVDQVIGAIPKDQLSKKIDELLEEK
jgi:thioredoxin 1